MTVYNLSQKYYDVIAKDITISSVYFHHVYFHHKFRSVSLAAVSDSVGLPQYSLNNVLKTTAVPNDALKMVYTRAKQD